MVDKGGFYKEVIDNLSDGVYFVDRSRVVTYWNKGAERITGYRSDEVLGRSCRDNLLSHVTAEGVQLCDGRCPVEACMEEGVAQEAEVFLHHADGHRVPVLIRAAPFHDEEGKIVGAVETFSSDLGDVAVRQQLRELRQQTRTDSVTGISNRAHLEGRLRALVAEFAGKSDAGVVFLDIDHFKEFNDAHGHDTGDRVLRMVAATLKSSLRGTDAIGRWGGEEFLGILYDVSSLESLRKTCEKLRTLVELSSLDLEGRGLSVTISVGGTLLHPADTPESIVHRADELMYRSKQAGRNRTTVA
jgi:diguanylate cyclase (GGDEF)-like protein/PAS domain S-box-containing protein